MIPHRTVPGLVHTGAFHTKTPGVLKNAIDWLSRPSEDIPKVFGGRPVAVIGTTPGQGGTSLAQTAWLPVLRTLGAAPWFGGRLMISNADEAFDGEGKMVDEKTRRRLAAFMEGFSAFVSERRR
jgi:chromate reductase, NAD(P)H dehydrogenase (quinone)